MATIETRRLFTITLEVQAPLSLLGDTPKGNRRIARVRGGHFEGDRLSGNVHDGGADWLLERNDGVLTLDVRITLETDDGALIYMSYRGLRHGPDSVMSRLNSGQDVDPSEYYFRVTPEFETGHQRYAWINKIMSIGTGRRLPSGPVYDVFEVL